MIRKASGHCRRYAQRAVNPREVVVHEVERDGMRMVLDLLAEAVR